MGERGTQPVFILANDSERSTGRTAQRNNILAAKLVAETVRTTLGPKGMDKMLVDSVGDVIVTNDGVTILEEMDIQHPAAKMVVEVARTQEDEVGDGTTTAVVLAGEFLRLAEELLDDKIHPTVIVAGYRLAQERAQRVLTSLAKPIDTSHKNLLLHVAQTAMTGKGAENDKEHLAQLTVEATLAVSDGDFSRDHVKIESRVGGSVSDSRLIEGIVLDKERVHPNMPQSVSNAKILLLDTALEPKQSEFDPSVSITDPSQLQTFLDLEEKQIDTIVSAIVSSGATAVLCQKGVDDSAAYALAKKGVFVVRRVKKSDLERLSRATGAKITSSLKDVSTSVLGSAGLVAQKSVGGEPMIFVEECKNAKAVTILVRGGTHHVIAEVSRAISDAVGDVHAALSAGSVVGGAGSIEILLAREIHTYARSLTGREQLAVEAFAKALEVIPRTLAENAGLDPIDALTDLKASNDAWPGINVQTGEVVDAFEEGVIEPVRIKTQAISSATDVAAMILRIDDVIQSGRQPQPPLPELD